MAEDLNDPDAFEREADSRRTGLLREFWDFVRHNKKWWLIPMLIVFVLIGILVVLGRSGAGPFIYAQH